MKVVFFGLYTPLQGAPTIGAAIAKVGAGPVRWTMIGRGQDRAATEAAAAAGGVGGVGGVGRPEVTWLDWVDCDVLPRIVAGHDVCLGIFGSTPKALRVVPNKVFQGAAAGCAIVTSDTPPQRHALGDAAVYVRPGDVDDLARAITALADDPSELERLRRAARQTAVERFGPTAVTRPLSSTLLAARATRRAAVNPA